jgi:hypothetical protein
LKTWASLFVKASTNGCVTKRKQAAKQISSRNPGGRSRVQEQVAGAGCRSRL